MEHPVLDCLGRPMINGAVYNPTTTRTATCTDGSTAMVRDPFPNNFIGAPSTWDPVAQKVLTYIPTPSGATASALNNNYPNMQPNNKYQYLTSIKIDHYDRSVVAPLGLLHRRAIEQGQCG